MTDKPNLPTLAKQMMAVKEPHRAGMGKGRPSAYDEVIAEHILDRMQNHGESLKAICKALPDCGLKPVGEASVRRWHVENVAGFSARFSRAREAQTHVWAEDLMQIADNDSIESGQINRDRLKVDTRKWLMSVLNPAQYGDRKHLEHTGADGGPIETLDTTELARSLLAVISALEHAKDNS